MLARRVHHPSPSDLFTFGLVHDIGKLALFHITSDLFSEVIQLCSEANITYSQAEEQLGVPTHTQIGALLAAHWRLPFKLQMTIKNHHQMDLPARGPLNFEENQIVDLVFLANIVAHALKFGNSGHSVIRGAPKIVLDRLGMRQDGEFQTYLREVKTQLSHTGEFLRLLGIS